MLLEPAVRVARVARVDRLLRGQLQSNLRISLNGQLSLEHARVFAIFSYLFVFFSFGLERLARS